MLEINIRVRSSSVRSKSGSSIRSRNRIEYTIERCKWIRHKSEASGDCLLSSIADILERQLYWRLQRICQCE